MPITFPVHASVAVPLQRLFPRALVPAAVVVGAMIPDASYMGLPGNAHTVEGLWKYNIPAAFLGYLLLELWVLPSLRRTLPTVRGLELARWAQPRGLPRNLLGWLSVGLSVSLGVASHLLWDGFTHAQMWPASWLYPHLKLASVPFSALLQELFSVFGTVFLFFWAVRETPRLAPLRAPPDKSVWPVAAPFVLGTGLGLVWHLHAINACNFWPQELWLFAWSGARGATLGLLLGCGVERMTPLNPPSPLPPA